MLGAELDDVDYLFSRLRKNDNIRRFRLDPCPVRAVLHPDCFTRLRTLTKALFQHVNDELNSGRVRTGGNRHGRRSLAHISSSLAFGERFADDFALNTPNLQRPD
jgi:hypothetical protein